MKASQAREWIEHAPAAGSDPTNGNLIGWQFGAGGDDPQCRETDGGPWYLCAACARRLQARGCSWSSRDASVIWKGGLHIEGCSVCGEGKAKTGHTPGPWRIAECPEIHGEGNAYEIETDGLTIAHVYADESMSANAALISAAPDLLESVRGLLACMETSSEFSDGKNADMLRAYEAISKATWKD